MATVNALYVRVSTYLTLIRQSFARKHNAARAEYDRSAALVSHRGPEIPRLAQVGKDGGKVTRECRIVGPRRYVDNHLVSLVGVPRAWVIYGLLSV